MSETPEIEGAPEAKEGIRFEDTIDILKDMRKGLDKKQKDYKKSAIPLEKETIGDQEVYKVQQEQLKSLEEQYSIILSAGFRFINPVLKRWKIDPLNNEEINNLSRATLNISERNIKQTVKKIEKRFSSLGKLTKIVELLAIAWEISLPRYDQLKASIMEIKAKQEGLVKQ